MLRDGSENETFILISLSASSLPAHWFGDYVLSGSLIFSPAAAEDREKTVFAFFYFSLTHSKTNKLASTLGTFQGPRVCDRILGVCEMAEEEVRNVRANKNRGEGRMPLRGREYP